ncbi:MAG: biotin/lipoyl-containing protein [Candidatus Eiseniibacteriota bacterium]
MKVVLRLGADVHEVEIDDAASPLEARITAGALSGEFRVTPLGPGRFRMSSGARTWLACVDREGALRHVTVEGEGEARFERETKGRRAARDAHPGDLSSPMPGTVVKVLAKVGDIVARGQNLLVVEAMKMEIQVSAPAAGWVRAIHAAEGDPCDAGQILAEVEPAEETT